MAKAPYLSVIIPSYNELQSLKKGVLVQVLSYLQQQKYTWEIILSDDGSTDGTLEKLQAFAEKHSGVKVLADIHAGKGPTVKTGMLSAQGKWRLYTDFDQSTPMSEIEKLWPRAKQGYDVIFGSRQMVGAARQNEPWYRHLMGWGFNLLVQIIAIPGIFDTQCGFKLLSAEATEVLFSQLYVYGQQRPRGDAFTGAFDVELLFLAKKYGYKLREVPIIWHHRETNRVDPIKDSIRMLIDIIRIRLAEFRGRYKRE